MCKKTCQGPSKIDALYIAYTIELNIPVVTDDQDMTELAAEFDVMVMPTLGLLKIMLDCGHINLKTIRGLIEYLRYTNDLPANLDKDYKQLFL